MQFLCMYASLPHLVVVWYLTLHTCLGSWSLYKLLIAIKLRETLHINTKSEMNVLSIGIHLCRVAHFIFLRLQSE